ncbi:MAG: site-2 protease family protein, partial [Actinobacteria bacterium]|nr:site-2 protease family protein [Actinomycetota bacterium]
VVGSVTSDTVKSIGGLFHGRGTHNVSSVVGITRATSQAYNQSFQDFVGVVGLISLALALGPLRARLDQGLYRVGFVIKAVSGPGDSFPHAVRSSFSVVGASTSENVKSIGGLFRGRGTHNVSSVVGITRATSQAYNQSLQDFIGVVGLISLALGLLNLLPVLPLDGGHIVMSLLEGLRGRAFSQAAYMRYSAVGMTLFVFLLYLGLRNDLGGGHS